MLINDQRQIFTSQYVGKLREINKSRAHIGFLSCNLGLFEIV